MTPSKPHHTTALHSAFKSAVLCYLPYLHLSLQRFAAFPFRYKLLLDRPHTLLRFQRILLPRTGLTPAGSAITSLLELKTMAHCTRAQL